MSSQGFSFPPPPPPPPPTSQQPTYPSPQYGWNGRGTGGRGRGRGHGNRGRGGAHYHPDNGRPSYANPPSYNYTPGTYGYPAPPAPPGPPTSYMPPPPFSQSQANFQHPQNPQAYQSPQSFSPPAGSPPYQSHPGFNNPAHVAHSASYPTPAAPTYPPVVSTHQHSAPTGAPMMMNSASWGIDMQPASGSFGGAPAGRGRGSWPSHGHGNHGPKPRYNNKRDHASAFNKPQKTVPRTPAPPAVPSFGNPLPCKPPPPADATRKPKKRKRKHNQLGLTPKTEEHESSEEEEDVDEESKLAHLGAGPGASTTAAPLQFTYRGQTATLQSPSDIAAWIAERRKKFPTAARVEEKQKAADEAKAAREAARREKEKEKENSMAKAKECVPKRDDESADPALDAAMKAQRKADKIRRNLDREQKRFAKAEAAAEAARLKVEALQKQALGLNGTPGQPNSVGAAQTDAQDTPADSIHTDESTATHMKLETLPRELSSVSAATVTVDATTDHLNGSVDVSSHESDGSDWTSSSGSESEPDSDNEDDDSAPEEVSSRRQGPERVPPPPREGKKQLCRHFARNGQCNRGDQCKFSHEVSERGLKHKPQPERKGRKGLFQALLDRQKEDEDRRAMEVISWLGQNGLLEPTNSSMPNGAPSVGPA